MYDLQVSMCSVIIPDDLPDIRDISDKAKGKGRERAFYTGGTSTCRGHIASYHYEEYQARCKAKGCEEQHRAVPTEVKEARQAQADAAAGRDPNAGTLLGMGFTDRVGPTEFTRESILEHAAKFIVCHNQVSMPQKKPLPHTDDRIVICNCRQPFLSKFPGRHASQNRGLGAPISTQDHHVYSQRVH